MEVPDDHLVACLGRLACPCSVVVHDGWCCTVMGACRALEEVLGDGSSLKILVEILLGQVDKV